MVLSEIIDNFVIDKPIYLIDVNDNSESTSFMMPFLENVLYINLIYNFVNDEKYFAIEGGYERFNRTLLTQELFNRLKKFKDVEVKKIDFVYNNGKANFIFKHRRNTHYDELEIYIRKVIDYEQYVLSIKPLTKSQSKCLQLADIVASSTYQAFEPNQYDGDVEPSYFMRMSDNIFTYKGKCLGYGLKLFPSDTALIETDKYSWINDILKKINKTLKN